MRYHYRSSLPSLVLLVLSAIVLISISASAQSSISVANGDDLVDAKVLSVPGVKLPKVASESGLGGRVIVRVSVDEKGNVVDGEASGPDWVCQNVSTPDVLALRSTAKAAALQARFSPATKGGQPVPSTMILNFDFPSSASKVSVVSARVVGDGNVMLAESPDPRSEEPKPIKFGNADTPTPSPDRPAGDRQRMVSGGVLNGKAMSLPVPQYPPAAKAVRASGAVAIQVLILEDGTVFTAQAVSGHPLLRTAARVAACGAKFTRTLLEGSPVKVSGIITYNFNL